MTALPGADEPAPTARETAKRCGVDMGALGGGVTATSPINGGPLSAVDLVDPGAVDTAAERAGQAFLAWRTVPAPAGARWSSGSPTRTRGCRSATRWRRAPASGR
ncbi:hypothetical protein [Nonomuraea jabiensis]|uniref:Aldehyde dehydrogenase family protein n=1 Tax=Nonomuraea jabiensis TaxID=882448 RepID=A0A7W9LE42_9ACTN|nr:hypothetical protein [Nonomuraea jabiensis]MBB5780446.1 hypothetical protein [Nonomuraea jabiensis]